MGTAAGLVDPVADSRERIRALDATRSFIVDAPAGSGKTELLIQRYLVLLARVEAPEAVVAITFTRKAASEMRDRVLRALRAASENPRPAKAHEALTWDLARAVLERNAEAGWELLDHPLRLRIQTIDSLCGAITRQMPWLSRFGAQPGIAEDAVELYREAAVNTWRTIGQESARASAVEQLLRHLDNSVAAFVDLLVAMLARREQWLRHVLASGQRESLEAALCAVIREGLAKVRRAAPEPLAEDIVELSRFAARNLDSSAPLAPCANLDALPGREVEDLPAWLGIASLLLTSGNTWRKRVNVKCGFPRDRKDEKQRIESLLDALSGNDRFLEALKELRVLPPPCYTDAQWQTMEALFTVLPLAVAQLRMVFSERGQVDFSEVAQAASAALGSPDRPTDLALALDCRIQHLLVDEFQDTSFSQCELLEKLTAGWERGDGRTLFVVGDPMQSIYRFREAEVGLFLKSRVRGIGSVKLEPLRLAVNFRSDSGIVKWVNAAFRRIFPEAEDIATGAIPFSESVPVRPAGAGQAVTVHPFIGADYETEAARTAVLVAQSRLQERDGKIAVLVRARTHLPLILRELRKAGLSYRAVEIDPLSGRPVIQDLLALTRALLHLADRTAWLAVLRAPWCGMTLADLLAIAGDDREATVWDLMRDSARLALMSADGRTRLERVRGVLDTCLGQSRRASLRRWVEGAWIALGGPGCLLTGAEWEDSQTFFDLLEGLESAGDVADLNRLLEKAEQLFAAPDLAADDKLQVMTIHKAKGLEFDTVILPGLGRTQRPDESKLLTWLESPGSEGESRLLLAPIKAAGAASEPMGDYLRHVENRKKEYETARLLYVAATRARKRLYLLGHTGLTWKEGSAALREPASGSLLSRLWPVVEAEFRACPLPSDVPPEAQPEPRKSLSIRRLPAAWSLPPAPEPVRWAAGADVDGEREVSFVWAGEVVRHIGTVVHRMLRRIAEEGVARWSSETVQAQRTVCAAALGSLGTPAGEIEAASAKVAEALERALCDPRGCWILDDSHAEARCEYAISGVVDGRVVDSRVDRTFVDADGTRWIIDYKTGTHEGGGLEGFLDNERARYAPQLEAYAALFEGMESRPVRLGLYFPLLGAWREWSPELQLRTAGL